MRGWRTAWTLVTVVPQLSLGLRPLSDPCALIAGKRWALPSEVRSCLGSFSLSPEVKSNVLEVVNKTLAFHTSVNYQIQAPAPYDNDVHEDLAGDLNRIAAASYASELDFHLDMYRSFKRVNDGHCGVYSSIIDYDIPFSSFFPPALYVTYLPTPLVLITEDDGSQNVYIAPEAYDIAKAEFKDSLSWWEGHLPKIFQGNLSSLAGRRVLLLNGQDPFVAVEANANITGGYQSHATRQNSFFASYHRGANGWEYNMGNFASLVHPLIDRVEMTVEYADDWGTTNVTFSLPYRSRFGSDSKYFIDSQSLRQNNCLATPKTNGIDMYGLSPTELSALFEDPPSLAHFQQQPPLAPEDYRARHPVNVLLDASPLSNIALPEVLSPRLQPSSESYSVAEFFMLEDGKTGVLALGSFSAKNFTHFGQALLDGLKGLKEKGAERLIVDVTNNGGGYICIAHWLHRILIGPKETTEPQAGLDTALRAGPLAQTIAKRVAEGHDPDDLLYYNPSQWNNATHQPFPKEVDWMQPRKLVINGREDAFSQRLGQECLPFKWKAPKRGLFDPAKTVIVSNGRELSHVGKQDLGLYRARLGFRRREQCRPRGPYRDRSPCLPTHKMGALVDNDSDDEETAPAHIPVATCHLG
ncbi:hypothetical protein NMY22_g1745 [Coprinellus aureogranulatus]|nr:hypothetical protein NMY22_g1745 [Coprinellus aureogranulatus]